jgi:hypothetical protein
MPPHRHARPGAARDARTLYRAIQVTISQHDPLDRWREENQALESRYALHGNSTCAVGCSPQTKECHHVLPFRSKLPIPDPRHGGENRTRIINLLVLLMIDSEVRMRVCCKVMRTSALGQPNFGITPRCAAGQCAPAGCCLRIFSLFDRS